MALARNVILVGTAVVAVPYTFQRTLDFLKRDAFASLRPSAATPDSPFAIQLQNVELRHYRGQKLLASAHANSVNVVKSRQEFDLYDVTNGVYTPDSGDPIQFAAKQSVWNAPLQTLFIRDGVRVQRKDFDLKTDVLGFNGNSQMIASPKPIAGRLYNGQVNAVTFNYNMKTGGYSAGPTTWVGLMAMRVKGGQVDETPTQWQINAQGSEYEGTNTQIVHYLDATAKDGEIIVKAPHVDLNKKTDVVTATGNVLYYAPEADMVADKIVIYRREKRAVLTGHVRMLIKPEDQKDQPAKEEPIPEFKLLDPAKVHVTVGAMTPAEKQQLEDLRSSDSLKKFPSQMAADQIEYWYAKGSRHAHITGNPQARQEFDGGAWRHVWANEGFYDGEAETLNLLSGKGDADWARMKNSGADDLMSKSFLVHTKKDDERFTSGPIKGQVTSTDEDLQKKKGDTAQPTTPPVVTPPTTTGGGTGNLN